MYHARHAGLAAHLAETGVRVDSLIVDAPYSERTHRGHDEAADTGIEERSALPYEPWDGGDVRDFVASWLPLVRGWWVSITDDGLAPEWRRAFGEAYLYPFTPIPLIEPGGRVRQAGDGSACWTCWTMTARPRSGAWLDAWRAERKARGLGCSLPGEYRCPPERHLRSARDARTVGGKPVAAMRAIVRDYAPLGGLVVDPCCGSGTTGIACVEEGVRFIGGDQDLAEAEKACRRIERAARQGRLFGTAPTSAEQLGLLGEG